MSDPSIAPSSPPASDLETPEEKQKRIERRGKFLGTVVYILARIIGTTLRMHFENFNGLTPGNKGAIIVTWHGRSLIPANVMRNRGYWALVSLSRDGEMQKNIFGRFGFQIIRGSSGKSGVKGALQMARKVKEGGVLTFTPDGPRGPTHKVQPGVILMAQKSGAPIVPLGVSASRRFLVKSWDSYMIPLPFARAYFLVGDPIYIPADISPEERESYCTQVEIAINRLEREAERRAGYMNYPSEWRTE